MKLTGTGPDWLAAEMPPGFKTRLLEIQRLTEDLQSMARFGRLLWAADQDLADATLETFGALKFDPQPVPGAPGMMAIGLDGRRRLIVGTASAESPIDRKHAVLAQLFDAVRQLSNEGDRVVLVVNTQPGLRPAERRPAFEPDALKLAQRLGANVLPSSALFALWTLSLQDRDRARSWVERLHAQDGGLFEIPALTTV